MSVFQSRELKETLVLLRTLGPKVEAIEKERDEALAQLKAYESGDDPLAKRTYTFAKMQRRIDSLVSEVDSWRQEVALQARTLKQMRSTHQPIEEERNRLQVAVRALQDENSQLSSNLTSAMRERDILARKLQQGLTSLTEAITEIQNGEEDVQPRPDE